MAEADFAAIRGICDNFIDEGKKLLESEGVAPDQQEIQLSMDIRYVGQEFYLTRR